MSTSKILKFIFWNLFSWHWRNRVGEIFSPLSHHQYVPFGIRRFNITSKHDAHCNIPNNWQAPLSPISLCNPHCRFFGIFHCFQIITRSLVLNPDAVCTSILSFCYPCRSQSLDILTSSVFLCASFPRLLSAPVFSLSSRLSNTWLVWRFHEMTKYRERATASRTRKNTLRTSQERMVFEISDTLRTTV